MPKGKNKTVPSRMNWKKWSADDKYSQATPQGPHQSGSAPKENERIRRQAVSKLNTGN